MGSSPAARIIPAFGFRVPAHYFEKTFVLAMASRSSDVFYWTLYIYVLSRRIGSPFPKLVALLQFTCGFEQRYVPNPYAM